MAVIYLDRRSQHIRVPRASLSAAAEDALAASRMALESIERAQQHLWRGDTGAIAHELSRVGFELQQRLAALTDLTNLADSAPAIDKAA